MKLLDYKPSTESDRKAHEQRWNAKRVSAYKDKKVAQEALEPAWWTYEDNDTLWIDENGG